MLCKFIYHNKDSCSKESIKEKKFCKIHMFYENKINLDDLKWCDKHTKGPLIDNKCIYCDKINTKILCKGFTNNKKTPCNFSPLDGDEYCKLHQTYKKWKLLTDSGKKICNNWIRGCFEEIGDTFNRCLNCRINERQKEKTLRDTKKTVAIKYNSENKQKMCYDCNCLTEKLFNNCCETCYKLKLNNSRTRNKKDIFKDRLYNYHKGAKSRNLEWKLDDEYAISLMKQICNYCNEKSKINGIDRINSFDSYNKNNCVPCCYQCNSMKSFKNVNDFYKICEHIATFNNLYKGSLYNELFLQSKNNKNIEKYISESQKRGIEFNLTKEQFTTLIDGNCFYCGNKNGGGIDRINSNEMYIITNCVSCCKTCNVMKLDFTKDQFIRKCLMITIKKKGILYKLDNIDKEKEKLIELFKNMKPVIETDNNIIYNYDKDYYKNLIWEGDINSLQKIKLELELVETSEQRDLWKYFRNTTSSLPFQKNSQLVGRQLIILVKDKITKKYLGIISLSSDLIHLEDRDDYIGWTSNQRVNGNKLKYIMNLSTCVPLQPFGFNFTGGKLLTKLAFSKEVMNMFENKYNHKLLGITTTGFHGKSIQYDRLKELKFVGYTKGNSVYKIPNELIDKCQTYLMSKGFNFSKRKKFFIVGQTLYELGLSRKDYMSDIPKGVYFGFSHHQSKDFLTENIEELEETKANDINIIFNDWINKFALKRYANLQSLDKLQNIENYKHIKKEEIANLDIKIKKADEEIKKQNKIFDKEYFKKHYQEKKKEKEMNTPIPTDKIIYPANITVYKEKETLYIQYNKSIAGIRHTLKRKIISNNIQDNLDNLIVETKNKYPNIVITDTKIINPYLFKLKEEEAPENPEIIIQDKKKPIMPVNFSICRVKDIDHIQFSKRIETTLYQYKTKINSYNIQSELNKFIEYLNETYKLNIEKGKVENSDNWKTTNKIKKSLTF